MKEITATVLFANLIDSMELGKVLTLLEYDEMLTDFQNVMFEVVSHHLEFYGYEGPGVDFEWSIMGDELRVFLYSGQTQFDIRNALLIATKIKIAWLVSTFNQKLFSERRQVSRIGIAIDYGEVIKYVRPWRLRMGQAQPNIEGYIINLIRHIESASREGTVSQIIVGDNLYKNCQLNNRINVSFSLPKNLSIKGTDQKIPVYEVLSFVNFEILPSMPSFLQEGLLEKMEYFVSDTVHEPWIFIILIRSYISMLASGDNENLAAKAIDLAQQALKVLDYKVVIYNMLGWIYSNCKSIRNLKIA